MKYKKTKITLIILSCILFVLIVILRVNRFKENELMKSKLINSIEQNEQIVLSELSNFQWNYVYIFPPYHDANKTLMDKGFRGSKHHFRIQHSIDHILMVFTYQDKLQTYVEIPRKYVGDNFDNYMVFSNKTAIFTVEESLLYFINT